MEDIRLLRGYKTRLLRTPLRLPWEGPVVPLEGSPRFLPALLNVRSGGGDIEVRVGPGAPLDKAEIAYIDGALLGSAALFSVFLSRDALRGLIEGAELAKEHLKQATGIRWMSSARIDKEISALAGDPARLFANASDTEVREEAFDAWLRHFSPLQEELAKVLASFKTDKRAQAESRARELVRAFRANNISIHPKRDVANRKAEITKWLNRHMESKSCLPIRPHMRGYARAAGGLGRKKPKAFAKEGPGASRKGGWPVLLFSNCRAGDKALFYSDFGSHLAAYSATTKGAVGPLVSLVHSGDFIRAPFLWWGTGPSSSHVHYYETISRGSTIMRATLLAVFGLLFDAATRALRGAGEKASLGNARVLIEAAVFYLYYALSNVGDDLRVEAVASAVERFARFARDAGIHSEIIALLDDHQWEGSWTLTEAAIFASRTPLPPWYLRRHQGKSDVEKITRLRHKLEDIKWI